VVALLAGVMPPILWVGRKTGSYPPGRGRIRRESSDGSKSHAGQERWIRGLGLIPVAVGLAVYELLR
jgi:hypothetical protein